MIKQEFMQKLSLLRQKCNEIPYEDYRSAWNVLVELRKFINENRQYLSKYPSEHIGDIEVDLDNFRSRKKYAEKKAYWESAMSNLNSEIDSLEHENDFGL